jgi:UDP-N-acetylglucosamine--N-acetylmuramyl-(pentapeptide) pyrophosphoryl-undecaprenol N-acetylglucosamine transferase
MQKLGLEPAGLAHAAEAAKSCGRPHATRDLANLVEQLGRPPVMDGVRSDDFGTATMIAALGA